MSKLLNSRHSIVLVILLFYFLPLFFLSSYALALIGPDRGWKLFSSGLLLASCGTLCLHCILKQWDRKSTPMPIPSEPPQIITIDNQAEIEELESALQAKSEELEQLHQDHYRELEQQRMELEYQWKSRQEALEQKTSQLNSIQQTLQDQQSIIDKKHQLISQLETKVSDLNYEIKTLIQLTEYDEASNVEENPMILSENPQKYSIDIVPQVENLIHTAEEATTQLKRCINIAQKITRPSHYADPNSRYLSLDNQALDLRHLFDNLRSEHNSAVLFFSQKENKLLFINNQIKSILGWNPEKMIQDFEEITQPSLNEWRKGISQLGSVNETQISLLLKSKTGSDVVVQGMLGIVPTGLFRNHVMGVLYQSQPQSQPSLSGSRF